MTNAELVRLPEQVRNAITELSDWDYFTERVEAIESVDELTATEQQLEVVAAAVKQHKDAYDMAQKGLWLVRARRGKLLERRQGQRVDLFEPSNKLQTDERYNRSVERLVGEYINPEDITIATSWSDLVKKARRKKIHAKDADARQAVAPDIVEGETVTAGDGWWMHHGDFRDILPRYAGQIDAIVTDPPYPVEFHPLWSDLAQLATTALVPQGMVIALTGKIHLDEVMRRLGEHLSYGWMYAVDMPGSSSRILARHVAQTWKPWLVYTNGTWPSGRIDFHPDIVAGRRDKTEYHWQQGIEDAVYLIERLLPPDAVIFDPFVGTGSYGEAALRTGRKFIGVELDAERYQGAVARLEGVE